MIFDSEILDCFRKRGCRSGLLQIGVSIVVQDSKTKPQLGQALGFQPESVVRRHWFRKTIKAVVALFVVFPGITSTSGQEDDKGFRDFRLVEPSELYRRLSVFEPENTAANNFDASDSTNLTKQAQSLFSALSAEQRGDLWKFTERYLDEKGLESDASKALMKKLGISQSQQESLAEQFNRMEGSGADRKNDLRKALRDALETSEGLKIDRGGKNSAANRAGARKATKKTQRVDRGNEETGGTPEADLVKPDIASDETKKQNRNKNGTKPPKTSGVGKGDSRDSEGSRKIENGKILDPLGLDTGVGEIGDPSVGEALNRVDSTIDPKLGSGKKAEKQAPNVGPAGTGDDDDETSKVSPEFDWQEDFNQIIGVESDSATGSTGRRTKDRERRGKKGDDSLSQKVADLGPAFLDKFLMRDSPEVDGEADPDAPTKDKPRLASVFDRTVVEAAREVLKASEDSEDDEQGFLARNFDSVFKQLVNSTASTNENGDRGEDSPRFNSEEDGWDRQGRSGGSGATLNSGLFNQRRSSGRSSNKGNRGGRRGNSEMESKDQAPAATKSETEGAGVGISSNGVFNLLFGLGIGGVILACLFTVLNRKFDSIPKTISDRAVARRIDRANFQSPQDLIALVDLFLLSKFGSESKWWNARHAKNVLLSDAPEFESNIDDLVHSYVRLRYMRAGGELTQSERDNCRNTLKSLSAILKRTDMPTRLKVEG